MKRKVALDVGDVRIGVAVSDMLGITANPRETYIRKGKTFEEDIAYFVNYAKIEDADLLIFSSPIYFGQVSAQAKTVIDRFYMISQNPERTLEGTKVIQVFTQANPSDAFDQYIKSMETMPFGFLGMEVIETISAKGAAGKGEGIEDALKKIEEMEI